MEPERRGKTEKMEQALAFLKKAFEIMAEIELNAEGESESAKAEKRAFMAGFTWGKASADGTACDEKSGWVVAYDIWRSGIRK